MTEVLVLDYHTESLMHDIIVKYMKVVAALIFIGAVTFVVLAKIWSATVSLGIISLDTTDVLSVILAVFAVFLSVLFYFKRKGSGLES